MSRFTVVAVAFAIATGFGAILSLAAAQTPTSLPTFGPPEVVDAPVLAVSPNGSTPLVQFEGDWYVAYSKNNEIWIRVRTPLGWLAPEAVTDDPAASHSPQLAAGNGELHLVWEDDRDGVPEVWTKRLVSGVWTADQCLSCDGSASIRPALAALSNPWSGEALVAWKEDVILGDIFSRFYDGTWHPAENVSEGTEGTHPPTVADHNGIMFGVLWPETNIAGNRTLSYRYHYDHPSSWTPITHGFGALPAPRLPSLFGDCSCADVFVPYIKVSYEVDILDSEIVIEPGDLLTDPEDGVSSVVPHIGGYQFSMNFFEFGPVYSRTLTVLSNDVEGGREHVVVQGESPGYESAIISDAGLDNVLIGSIRPDWPDDVMAEFLVAYIEDVDGTPTLLVRHAEEVGCTLIYPEGPDALVIAPEGYDNTYFARDVCDGELFRGMDAFLRFDGAVLNDLVWHEATPPAPMTWVDMYAGGGTGTFSARGGGCSQAGDVEFRLTNYEGIDYSGIKSPDIDGSCLVDGADRDYVTSLLETDDFCADLDGSGIVDAADVAIVDATMGDSCDPDVVAVGPGEDAHALLGAHPNPTSAGTRFSLGTDAGRTVELAVFDIAGRAVRTFPSIVADGGICEIEWDLHTDAGRRVSPGVYFARATIGESIHHLRVNVLR